MAGGLAGGGGGKNTGGGISPEQMALTQFHFGEGALANAAQFGKSGMGHSTMGTMADAGTYMGQALEAQKLSMADTAATNAANQQQKSQISSGIGGLGSIAGGAF
jgi:hypothetical protein